MSCTTIKPCHNTLKVLSKIITCREKLKRQYPELSLYDTSSWICYMKTTKELALSKIRISLNIYEVSEYLEFSEFLDDLNLVYKLLEYDYTYVNDLLYLAVYNQKLLTVQYICQFGVNIDTKNNILIEAVRKSNLDIVTFLCENGAEFYACNNLAIRHAACYADVPILRYFLCLGAQHYPGYGLVLSSAINGYQTRHNNPRLADTIDTYDKMYTETFKYLLQFGNNNEFDVHNIYILSAIYGNLDLLQYLWNNVKINIDGGRITKNHPLILALKNNRLHIVQFLLNKGGRKYYMRTIKYICHNFSASLGLIEFLIEIGYDICCPDDYVLIMACSKGNLKLVEFLCEHGADVKSRLDCEDNGHFINLSPLQAAADNGHIDVVKYLLSNGAVIDFDYGQCYSHILNELYSFEKNINKIKRARS